MATTDLKFGIPSIELRCRSGAKINPASFAGHHLIILFCPLDPAAARSELAAYVSHSDDFVKDDAWLLTFAEHSHDPSDDGADRVLTIADPEQRAWKAFRGLTAHPDDIGREGGATFFFTRGGNLHRYWGGSGHVEELLGELRTPSSQHQHQLRV